jgi:hypothetical protein
MDTGRTEAERKQNGSRTENKPGASLYRAYTEPIPSLARAQAHHGGTKQFERFHLGMPAENRKFRAEDFEQALRKMLESFYLSTFGACNSGSR